MPRRASRSPGLRTRRAGAPSRPTEPLHALRTLEAARASARAERALELWERAIVDDTHAFTASAAALATGDGFTFTPNERRLLLAMLAEQAADPDLLPMLDTLADRLDAEANTWALPEDETDDEDEVLREASPAYRALSDAYDVVRSAQEVLYLTALGRADLARELATDPAAWDRACTDGHATLLGRPRIVSSPDDDPFGILRS